MKEAPSTKNFDLCRIKDMHIIDLSHKLLGLQKSLMDVGENSRENINNKNKVIEVLFTEVNKIIARTKKEIENILKMYEAKQKRVAKKYKDLKMSWKQAYVFEHTSSKDCN